MLRKSARLQQDLKHFNDYFTFYFKSLLLCCAGNVRMEFYVYVH